MAAGQAARTKIWNVCVNVCYWVCVRVKVSVL